MTLKKLLGKEGYKTFRAGLWTEQPISCAVLGICSSLAVTNRVDNAIAMGLGVTFVLVAIALTLSIMRSLIPMRVRLMSYMITISTFVIIVDKVLKAGFPEISTAMGPYVGLIITNCILLGRAEAFYSQNGPRLSALDAIANGMSYSLTLIVVAVVRELLGFGTLLGFRVMPSAWENWVLMSLAPGAFFLLGIFLWIIRTLAGVKPPREG